MLLEYDTFLRPEYRPDEGVWPLLDAMLDAGQPLDRPARAPACRGRAGRSDVEVSCVVSKSAPSNDALMADMPDGSVMINATGMGFERLDAAASHRA